MMLFAALGALICGKTAKGISSLLGAPAINCARDVIKKDLPGVEYNNGEFTWGDIWFKGDESGKLWSNVLGMFYDYDVEDWVEKNKKLLEYVNLEDKRVGLYKTTKYVNGKFIDLINKCIAVEEVIGADEILLDWCCHDVRLLRAFWESPLVEYIKEGGKAVECYYTNIDDHDFLYKLGRMSDRDVMHSIEDAARYGKTEGIMSDDRLQFVKQLYGLNQYIEQEKENEDREWRREEKVPIALGNLNVKNKNKKEIRLIPMENSWYYNPLEDTFDITRMTEGTPAEKYKDSELICSVETYPCRLVSVKTIDGEEFNDDITPLKEAFDNFQKKREFDFDITQMPEDDYWYDLFERYKERMKTCEESYGSRSSRARVIEILEEEGR